MGRLLRTTSYGWGHLRSAPPDIAGLGKSGFSSRPVLCRVDCDPVRYYVTTHVRMINVYSPWFLVDTVYIDVGAVLSLVKGQV